MKKILLLILVFAMMIPLYACGDNTVVPDSTEPSVSDVPAADSATAADITTVAPVTTAEPEKSLPTTLKILAIGNSFSTDCMEYLWRILYTAGVKNPILGNLYYGGCTMEQHATFGKTDSASYTYYKSVKGSWNSTKNYKMSKALADEDWDIITIQESSKVCGIASAYQSSLKPLVNIVRSQNTKARLVFNMTWAYQQDSTHSAFPKYDKSQIKMYNMTCDCVQKYVVAGGAFEYVIPVGTAVQNARTSFLGDTLTRDGYHLNKQYGRFLAAMCWASTILDIDAGKLTKYNPASSVITPDMMNMFAECVNNARKAPFAVTESSYKSGKGPNGDTATQAEDPAEELNPQDSFEADKKLMAGAGIDLEKFKLLSWDYLENRYWSCTTRTDTVTPSSTASTYKQNICTDKKFSLSEIPVGSIFVCDPGWQYRIELFNDPEKAFNGTRPGLSHSEYFILTEEFLQGAKYLAFNVASYPKSDISALYQHAWAHIRVYVPQ